MMYLYKRKGATLELMAPHSAVAEADWIDLYRPTPEQAAMVNDHPEMVRFMHNHVVPDIQAILGADPYDPVAQTGFSCFSCHPHGG